MSQAGQINLMASLGKGALDISTSITFFFPNENMQKQPQL